MPYLTQIIDGGTGIFRTAQGVVTGAEIADGARVARELPNPERITHVLADFSAATEFNVTPADMKRIVSEFRANQTVMRRLYVASFAPSDTAFGLARMWEQSVGTENWVVRTFRTMDEAKAWLKEVVPE